MEVLDHQHDVSIEFGEPLDDRVHQNGPQPRSSDRDEVDEIRQQARDDGVPGISQAPDEQDGIVVARIDVHPHDTIWTDLGRPLSNEHGLSRSCGRDDQRGATARGAFDLPDERRTLDCAARQPRPGRVGTIRRHVGHDLTLRPPEAHREPGGRP